MGMTVNEFDTDGLSCLPVAAKCFATRREDEPKAKAPNSLTVNPLFKGITVKFTLPGKPAAKVVCPTTTIPGGSIGDLDQDISEEEKKTSRMAEARSHCCLSPWVIL